MLNTVAVLLTLTAAFSYVNHRYLKWPMTIGVMAIALAVSLVVIGLDQLGFETARGQEDSLLASIDFSEVLMQGMLSFLLFAAALHVDFNQLRRVAWQVGAFAFVGTALSTLLIGFGSWQPLWLGFPMSLPYRLLFGAHLADRSDGGSGLLKSAKVPKSIEATIAGESLVNDGVGVVLFALTLEMLQTGAAPTLGQALALFAREALGGAIFGLAVGYLVYRVLRTIDAPQIEILITIATVVGGYALARALHVSGPLAMVAIGLLIGNAGRALAMSEQTRYRLDMFWQLLDEILNGVLFVMIGLEFTLIVFPSGSFIAAVPTLALCLLVRYLVVGVPTTVGRRWFGLPPRSGLLLMWSGVRGGISVALALSLPPGPDRNLVLMPHLFGRCLLDSGAGSHRGAARPGPGFDC
jgi:CPA1 family monovalent cation:H+ antiporter